VATHDVGTFSLALIVVFFIGRDRFGRNFSFLLWRCGGAL